MRDSTSCSRTCCSSADIRNHTEVRSQEIVCCKHDNFWVPDLVRSPAGRWRLTWSTPARQLLQQPLRQRFSVRRKLIGSGAEIRTALTAGVRQVADVPYLAQRLAVMIEQRRRDDLACAGCPDPR